MDADSSASIDSVGGSSLQVQLAANFNMGFFFFFLHVARPVSLTATFMASSKKQGQTIRTVCGRSLWIVQYVHVHQ